MSSNAVPAIRNNLGWAAPFMLFVLAVPLAAQDDGGVTPDPAEEPASEASNAKEDDAPAPDVINLMITVPRGEVDEIRTQRCKDDADAAQISQEIVVCREILRENDQSFSGSRKEARERYARETAFEGDPQAPNVAGAGIFTGPATVSGQCFIPPCPDEPALIIDIEALPEAPPGSDADRIARGLPPLNQEEPTEEEIRQRREALGLPAPAIPEGP
ncbi:MAG: hypothetical protein AAGK02_07895 [Pseudomonadota bacterium]